MNETIDRISPETLAMIESQAKLAGISVDDYLRGLMPIGNGGREERPLYETATPQELADAYVRWAESHDLNIPGLSIEDMSRETIY